MQNFALIGAAGYIAPRHIKAIADTGNNLMVAYDKFDSVGRLDSSFPECSFFTENEQFDRFCSKQMRTDNPLSWMSICTPNYTHDAFIRYGLRLGCNVICEKPLVLNPYNIDNLVELEQETGCQAYTILQLRLHDKIAALREKVKNGPKDKIYDVDLTYITSRGKWYYSSWKGDIHKAGGIATNIGVHFYDMLQWIFGAVKQNIVHVMSFDRVAGYLELEHARVRYFLSINADCLPANAVQGEKKILRLTPPSALESVLCRILWIHCAIPTIQTAYWLILCTDICSGGTQIIRNWKGSWPVSGHGSAKWSSLFF